MFKSIPGFKIDCSSASWLPKSSQPPGLVDSSLTAFLVSVLSLCLWFLAPLRPFSRTVAAASHSASPAFWGAGLPGAGSSVPNSLRACSVPNNSHLWTSPTDIEGFLKYGPSQPVIPSHAPHAGRGQGPLLPDHVTCSQRLVRAVSSAGALFPFTRTHRRRLFRSAQISPPLWKRSRLPNSVCPPQLQSSHDTVFCCVCLWTVVTGDPSVLLSL